jgi:20S proteasome subunit beta 1
MRRLNSSRTVSSHTSGNEQLTDAITTALALAMARDGSSGGVIRMAVITEDGVERLFVPGNELPTFWEGLEVLGSKPVKQAGVVPMAIEPL